MEEREREDATVADANRKLSRGGEGERTPTSQGDADDDVTRANQQIARGEEHRGADVGRDAALLNPPD